MNRRTRLKVAIVESGGLVTEGGRLGKMATVQICPQWRFQADMWSSRAKKLLAYGWLAAYLLATTTASFFHDAEAHCCDTGATCGKNKPSSLRHCEHDGHCHDSDNTSDRSDDRHPEKTCSACRFLANVPTLTRPMPAAEQTGVIGTVCVQMPVVVYAELQLVLHSRAPPICS